MVFSSLFTIGVCVKYYDIAFLGSLRKQFSGLLYVVLSNLSLFLQLQWPIVGTA